MKLCPSLSLTSLSSSCTCNCLQHCCSLISVNSTISVKCVIL
uniref:Uncharacterized protein n=1 Tax=Rhizophora mucronata TaxID=61149 RepID=A0A2P2MXK3_RHIMU